MCQCVEHGSVSAGWERKRVGAHDAPNTLDPKGTTQQSSSVFPSDFVPEFHFT